MSSFRIVGVQVIATLLLFYATSLSFDSTQELLKLLLLLRFHGIWIPSLDAPLFCKLRVVLKQTLTLVFFRVT
jgi:hypothetical protein